MNRAINTEEHSAIANLAPEELAGVAGGMIKIERHDLPKPGDEGTTWVPEGTVKVYLAGVQIN